MNSFNKMFAVCDQDNMENSEVAVLGSYNQPIYRQYSQLQNNPVQVIDEHEDPRTEFKHEYSKIPEKSSKRRVENPNISEDNFGKTDNREAREHEYSKNKSFKYHQAVENDAPYEDNQVRYALTKEQTEYEKNGLVLHKPTDRTPGKIFKKDQLRICERNTQVAQFVEQLIRNANFSKVELLQYKSHFEHAFSCPKLSNSNECWNMTCTDPKGIERFVNEALQHEYKAGENVSNNQRNFNMVHLVVLWHAFNCTNPNICTMPLCGQMEELLDKIMPDSSTDEFYQVLHSSNSRNENQFVRKGTDFDLLFDLKLAKGGFGVVSYSCFYERSSERKYGLVLKRVDLQCRPEIITSLNSSIPALKDLCNLPNVMVPELILRSDNEVLMLMEKAEMSLFELMKYRGGMEADEVTYYVFQIMNGVKQIHSLGYTHGDIKVSNCLLTKGCRILQIADLDSVKEENEIIPSGTMGYASPEVLENRTVGKPDDVHAAVTCIPALFAASESILIEKTTSKLLELVLEKDYNLASVYLYGIEPSAKRPTAENYVKWFCQCETLRPRWEHFEPSAPPTVKSGKNFAQNVVKNFFQEILSDLPQSLCNL